VTLRRSVVTPPLQVFLAFLVCALGFPRLLFAAPAPPPNIILIVTDNLGYGDIEPFGSTLLRTPLLTCMAREGRRFTHFYVTAGVQVEAGKGQRRVTAETEQTGVDGYDITDLVLGTPGAVSPHPAVFYFQERQLQAVRAGPWKLFLPLEGFRQHPHFKRSQENGPLLCHLLDDVACKTNQAKAQPEIVAKLMAFAEQARAEFGTVEKKGNGQRSIGRVEGEPKAVLK